MKPVANVFVSRQVESEAKRYAEAKRGKQWKWEAGEERFVWLVVAVPYGAMLLGLHGAYVLASLEEGYGWALAVSTFLLHLAFWFGWAVRCNRRANAMLRDHERSKDEQAIVDDELSEFAFTACAAASDVNELVADWELGQEAIKLGQAEPQPDEDTYRSWLADRVEEVRGKVKIVDCRLRARERAQMRVQIDATEAVSELRESAGRFAAAADPVMLPLTEEADRLRRLEGELAARRSARI